MVKDNFKKPFYYILIFIFGLVILLINKNYSGGVKLDLSNVSKKQENYSGGPKLDLNNSQRKQESKSNDALQPIALSRPTSEQPLTTSSNILNSNSQINKGNDSLKIKNLGESFRVKNNVIVLKCQHLKENDKVFFFKDSGFYGEVNAGQDKVYYLFYDNCLWLWAKSKKTGLKICSSEINVPLIGFNPEKVSDEEITKIIKEKKLNIYCYKTQINEVKFLPPSDIEFLLIDPNKENLLDIF